MPLRSNLRKIYVLVYLAFCASPLALARDKTDVIVMKNGDRITGEVKQLENGVLSVSLDYVDGTISIDWLKVARIESSSLFLVQLENGSIFSAKVVNAESPTGNPVTIEIQPDGQEPLVVEKSTVARMTQTSESVVERFSGQITAGVNYSKGNNTTQFTFGSEVDYQETRWGGRATYGSNLSSSSGATTATRNQVDLIAYRLLPWKNYFYAGTGGFLQSSVQGIQQQANLGIGLGRFLKNNNRIRFSVLGGLGWQKDNYVPAAQAERSQDIGVALVSSNLQIFSFKKTQFNLNVALAPALTQSGRLFSRINATYYLKLFGQVDWNLSFYGNWDTQPPAQLPSSDYGTSIGLSWKFGNK